MDFELSEEHQLAYESALAFGQKEIRPHIAEMERDDAFPAGLWRKLGEQGFTGIAIPEAYGGSGGDIMMAALAASGIARTSAAIATSYFAHLNLCAHNILRNGSERQRQKYLPGLASTSTIGALALTEPDAGSDAMGIRATARSVDGGYLINGTKVFITNGPIADVMVLYAKTRPEAGSRGITAFIFETKTPGFHVARKLTKVGLHGSPTGELVFEDAFVPQENVLGTINEGYKVVKEAAAAVLFVSRAASRAANEALQIHGGSGYLTDFDVERLWRDARLGEIGAGTNEIRQLLIARELLGMRG